MKAYIISDKDELSAPYRALKGLIHAYLNEKGFETTVKEVGRGDVAFCTGCFGCWVKKPGECVIADGIAQINRNCMNSDVVFYLCPIVFGQFSANIKTVIERWLPNMLPFFQTRSDGSTMHPPRYRQYPQQIFLGCSAVGSSADGCSAVDSSALSKEDEQLFVDILKKHRRNVEALVYTGSDSDTTAALNNIKLHSVGAQL